MKTAAQLTKLREKNFVRHHKEGCQIKVRHPNVLSAIQHCQRLSELGDKDHRPVIFYYCDLCGFTHVGHLGTRESIAMYGAYAENLRELQGLVS